MGVISGQRIDSRGRSSHHRQSLMVQSSESPWSHCFVRFCFVLTQGLSKLPRLATSWISTCLTLWQVPPRLLVLVPSSGENVLGEGLYMHVCLCVLMYTCTCVYRSQRSTPVSFLGSHSFCLCVYEVLLRACVYMYLYMCVHMLVYKDQRSI